MHVSAKQKLNKAHVLGALLIAAVVGGLTGSLTVFWIALFISLIAAYHAGDIRR